MQILPAVDIEAVTAAIYFRGHEARKVVAGTNARVDASVTVVKGNPAAALTPQYARAATPRSPMVAVSWSVSHKGYVAPHLFA